MCVWGDKQIKFQIGGGGENSGGVLDLIKYDG